MERGVRRPAGNPPLCQPCRRPAGPAPRHAVRNAGDRAVFDEAAHRWTVRTDRGDVRLRPYLRHGDGMPVGGSVAGFPGISEFRGDTYHTGHWPHEGVDFSGLRVGVVGTGSSAIQAIPVIAAQAAHVTVFQRTPNFSIPSRNRADAGGVRKVVEGGLSGEARRSSD